jgi:hypothetical protein
VESAAARGVEVTHVLTSLTGPPRG